LFLLLGLTRINQELKVVQNRIAEGALEMGRNQKNGLPPWREAVLSLEI